MGGIARTKAWKKKEKVRPKRMAGTAGVTAVALGGRSSEEEARDTPRWDANSFESHRLVLSGGLSVLIRIVP